MRITFELSDDDLKHFRLIMQSAQDASQNLSRQEIIGAAQQLLSDVAAAKVPDFIRERLNQLALLIEMLNDEQWRLPETEVRRVLSALSYFSEPDDLIPDDIPGVGFLDDAIMVELVVRELNHEIDAYRDFCAFRTDAEQENTKVTRADWLKARRGELQSRMKERRAGDKGKKRGPLGLM